MMRFRVLQLRYFARVWWGPLTIAAGGLMLGLVKYQVLGGAWIWAGLGLLALGIVRAAVQSTGPLSDSEVTRLPMQGDGDFEAGANHADD